MATQLPSFACFDPEVDANTAAARWDEWLDGLETMIQAMNVSDHDHKWALLKHYAGPKCQKIEKQLTYKTAKYRQAPNQIEDHYQRLKDAFTSYFKPQKNVAHAAFIFQSMKQKEGETVAAFVV